MENISLILQLFINKFTTTIIETSKLFSLDFNGGYGQVVFFTIIFLSFIISINILLGLINILKRKGL